MALVEVKVPDIGDFKEVAVIELLVQPGDTIQPEQSLLTVESDKASMEIPATQGGVVKALKVKLGDKISEGTVIALVESSASGVEREQPKAAAAAPAPASDAQRETPNAQPVAAAGGSVEVRVPDIGDFKDVAVIEVLVKPGDTVKVEQSLVTVESDKASMEIPSSSAGVVKDVKVKLGDKINIGDLIAVLEGQATAAAAPAAGPSPQKGARR